MWTFRSGILLLTLAALLPVILQAGLQAGPHAAHADEPIWYKNKKAKEKEDKEIEAQKAKEKPAVGNNKEGMPEGASTLSAPNMTPPNTSLLFNREGMTDSLGIDTGYLSQPDINGLVFTGQYTFGWWMTPKIIVSGAVRLTSLFSMTHVFLMAGGGPQVRYLISKKWIVGATFGYALSQGLSRVPEANIPPPPGPQALGLRRGLFGVASVSYLFWPKRSIAVGPTFSVTMANQNERSVMIYALGITYQSGRPNYTGSVTED